MPATRFVVLVFLITVGIAIPQTMGASVNNKTQAFDNDSDDLTSLASESVALRDRYRRLIPYMTYYLMNNYVHQQPTPAPLAPFYQNAHQPYVQVPKEQVDSSPTRARPATAAQQYATLRPIHLAGSNRYQPLHKLQEGRFVPSVQYDPKDVGLDTDYFVPVRYVPKDYEDYTAVTVRTTRPIPVPSSPPDGRYPPTTLRPIIGYVKPVAKPQAAQDFASNADFESVRFIKPQRTQLQPHLQQVPPRYTAARPTRVSLGHIVKSLQLTSRLPEVLNNDNIDSSIRTLEEILRILNVGKKETYRPPAYEKLKPAYSKPKVITETNYEASQLSVTPHNELIETKPALAYVAQVKAQMPVIPHEAEDEQQQPIELKPAGLYVETQMPAVPHDPQLLGIKSAGQYVDRLKVDSAQDEEVVEIKPKNLYKNRANTPAPIVEKIVEYYVPIIQDIDEDKPPVDQAKGHQQSTDDRYIGEDNEEKQLEDDKYSLPMTTEPMQKLAAHLQNIQPLIKYGVTRGKPQVDYPAYTEIPETQFNCKQQRYKGFFGDPETGCQVWHYCDLNGGKSSFLCPNGTIFSQVSLTCDWWFNVKCESTTQLYVLNERLYKYILPIMPKFPEDFSGPEVDKYLELKFKEMEAKMKEKKKKKEQEEEKDKNTINTLQSIEDSK